MSIQQCKWGMTRIDECGLDNGELAQRWLGLTPEQIEARVGRFTRGKRKGKLRGWIVFRSCIQGGWCFPLHAVIRPGMIFATFVEKYDEIGEVISLDTAKFMARAVRVDSQYGHVPKGLRKEEPKPEAPAPERKPLEIGEKLLFGKEFRLDNLDVTVVAIAGDTAVLSIDIALAAYQKPIHVSVDVTSLESVEADGKWDGYRAWRKTNG